MKSLMFSPSGAERCIMTLHLPDFFKTTSRPEQCRDGSGRWRYGPARWPFEHSLESSASIT